MLANWILCARCRGTNENCHYCNNGWVDFVGVGEKKSIAEVDLIFIERL